MTGAAFRTLLFLARLSGHPYWQNSLSDTFPAVGIGVGTDWRIILCKSSRCQNVLVWKTHNTTVGCGREGFLWVHDQRHTWRVATIITDWLRLQHSSGPAVTVPDGACFGQRSIAGVIKNQNSSRKSLGDVRMLSQAGSVQRRPNGECTGQCNRSRIASCISLRRWGRPKSRTAITWARRSRSPRLSQQLAFVTQDG